ncbi:MAG TPA: M20/M25/M40 family metallo-hydrolase [Bacillota bacterium]|nr:M20/M25/M40 family metallo-hydrolase [Bacillota bacterium]
MNQLNSLLNSLIKVDSSTKEEANNLIEFAENWLKIEGISRIKILENNGYKMLIADIGSGEQTIVLNGHVDVVSGNKEQFTPIVEDGKLYARGSADMKAGVAAIMCAFVELNKIVVDCNVQLQLVSDEEIGGKNCAAYLTDEGYLGDFVICPEPTQLGIGLQAKGVLQLDIHVKGIPAHSSRPWEGENAIEKAVNMYQQIKSLPFAKESSSFFEAPSINLSKISGGDVYNKVPDACKMSIDIRFLPSQRKDDILHQIKQITGDQVDVILYGDPVNNSEEDKEILHLIDTIKKHTKEDKVSVFGQHGFADTRYFSRYGIPAVEFGPTGEDWHGERENVELESVETYKNIIVDLATSLYKK